MSNKIILNYILSYLLIKKKNSEQLRYYINYYQLLFSSRKQYKNTQTKILFLHLLMVLTTRNKLIIVVNQ